MSVTCECDVCACDVCERFVFVDNKGMHPVIMSCSCVKVEEIYTSDHVCVMFFFLGE